MKRWKHRLVLLGVAALLAACATAQSPQEKPSPDVQSPQPDDRTAATPLLTSLVEMRPCSIEKATPTSDGVRIAFDKGMSWSFDEPPGGTGNGGVIGNGIVIRFVTGPDGHDDALPAEPHIDLKFGQKLRLSDHHAACAVWAIRDQERLILRTKRSFCMTSMPCSHAETAHELRG